MASHNDLLDEDGNPVTPVQSLLDIVHDLSLQVVKPAFCAIRNRPSPVARSNDEDANEIYNPNIPFGMTISTGGARGGVVTRTGGIPLLIGNLESDVQLIERRLINLQGLQEEVTEGLSKHIHLAEILLKKMESSPSPPLTKWLKKDIEDICKLISGLVGKLSVLPNKPTIQKALYSHDSSGDNNGRRCSHLPGLQDMEDGLTKCEIFRHVKHEFVELETQRKMCLLSFAVFPANREVHRTVLMYWWIGEGILPVQGAEKTVREILQDFTEKNLIDPVEERRKVAPSSYKMTPFVHSSVVLLSKQIGLFDIYHKGRKPSMIKSEMGKVCLVEGSSSHKRVPPMDIESVFNVSETDPEFTFRWFSEYIPNKKRIKLSKTLFKSLHVFYLGRWERNQKRYIQVRNPELMKCLKRMKKLRILSFQGISTVKTLKSSVCELHNLIILDLRECYDLTKLPEKIDSLQSLVYLDMTGCYMLEWIPMRLALLKNLEVLKGFVVSDTIYEGVACKLNLLERLKKLRKLSIEIQRDDIGLHQLMEDLVELKALTSLRVTWRRDLNVVRARKSEDFTKVKILPHQLKKLDLHSFPHEQLPTWLQPEKLVHLKKLHIGGGKSLKGFGELPEKTTQCAVEVLRLTSLPKLRVGWIELKKILFPKLIFLESYECPKVSLTPCDGDGIWRSDQDE